MLQEFKKFALRGNVIDLAVGVIIGAAFGKIVDSLVKDVMMPIIGAIFGSADFSNFFLPLSRAVNASNLLDAQKQGAVLAYGSFITAVVNFLIVAFSLFIFIRALSVAKDKLGPGDKPAAPPPPRSEVLLEEIRDLLSKK
jgi:large conductance mechanosensitive channel